MFVYIELSCREEGNPGFNFGHRMTQHNNNIHRSIIQMLVERYCIIQTLHQFYPYVLTLMLKLVISKLSDIVVHQDHTTCIWWHNLSSRPAHNSLVLNSKKDYHSRLGDSVIFGGGQVMMKSRFLWKVRGGVTTRKTRFIHHFTCLRHKSIQTPIYMQ